MATQPPEPPENWRPMQHPQQWGPPPPPQPPKLPIYRQWWFVLGAIVAASLVIVAITNSGEQFATTTTTRATVQHQSQTTSRPEPTKPQADASAQLACDHFRNVADDISSGVLKRFAPSSDIIGAVLAAWRHETNRLPPQRPRSARPPGVPAHLHASRRAVAGGRSQAQVARELGVACPRTPSHVGWRTASRVGRCRASCSVRLS
jgi:hypothetical protein